MMRIKGDAAGLAELVRLDQGADDLAGGQRHGLGVDDALVQRHLGEDAVERHHRIGGLVLPRQLQLAAHVRLALAQHQRPTRRRQHPAAHPVRGEHRCPHQRARCVEAAGQYDGGVVGCGDLQGRLHRVLV
ncbi:MAG: hypothetical protein U0168_09060 [Nannocystaceae bacterium]